MELQRRRDVGQQNELRGLMRFRQSGGERFENTQFRQKRPAVIHIDLVFARPMEGLAWQNLETFEINPVSLIEPNVTLWKIVTHNADELDRAEEARGHGGMAGRAAEQTRIFCFRCFDGIEGGRTDNEDTHAKSLIR